MNLLGPSGKCFCAVHAHYSAVGHFSEIVLCTKELICNFCHHSIQKLLWKLAMNKVLFYSFI